MEESEPFFTTIGRGTLWLFLGTVLGYIVIFFYRIFLARYLGPDDLGAFSLVLMLHGIFMSLFSMGIPFIPTKFIAQFKAENKDYNKVYSNGLQLTLLTGGIASGIMFFFADVIATTVFHNPSLTIYFRVGAIGVLFMQLSSYLNGAFLGLQRMKLSSFILFLEKVSRLGFTTGLLLLGYGVTGAVLGHIASLIFSSFLFLWFVFRRKMFSLRKYDSSIMPEMFTFGMVTYLGSIAVTTLNWVDTFFIGFFLTQEAVGLYNAVLPVLWLLGILVSNLAAALLPAFSEIHAKKNDELLTKMLNKALNYSFILLLPMAVGAILLSNDFISVVFGDAYLSSVQIFRILAVGAVFVGINGLYSTLFASIGKPKTSLAISIVMVCTNVILDIILIQKYGMEGAAIATVISLLLAFVVYSYILKKDIQLKMHLFLKPLFASLAMGVIVYSISEFLPSSYIAPVVKIVVGSITYFAILWAIKGIEKHDFEFIQGIISSK